MNYSMGIRWGWLAALTSAWVTLTAAEITPAAVEASVQQAHAELWRRFIDPHYYTFYDYVGPQGEVILPTAEECQTDKPNALAWWTPVENGAFFGGLYLDALTQRWQQRHDEASAREAHEIAQGLLRLATVGKTPGFIARGVAADGQSHYGAGSDDQTFPWFYGLRCYLRSGLPTGTERQELVSLIKRTGDALEKNGWRLPCDRPGFGPRGSLVEPNCISAPRLLFVLRALHEITGEEHWLTEYQQRRDEVLPGGQTRLELCAGGGQYGPPGSRTGHPLNSPFWTSASCQAAMKALAAWETDPAIRAKYQEGLHKNAAGALPHLQRGMTFDNAHAGVFSYDWRPLNAAWQAQKTVEDSVKMAMLEVKEWNKLSPGREYVFSRMREPLFAAWIVVLSGDRELIASAKPELRALLTHYDWTKLNISLFFAAELVYQEGRAYGW